MRTKEKGESLCGRALLNSGSSASLSAIFRFAELKFEATITRVRNGGVT